MATTIPSAALVPITPVFTNTERLALAGFLAGYSGLTRHAYELDLRASAGPPRCRADRPAHRPPRRDHQDTLRHAFITAALDAGVPLRDVQETASHADPRTTMRYDRARTSLDRHATYIVAAYVAGAAR
jgi:integrase/recombinase XerD